MKKSHIVILIAIMAAIIALLVYGVDFSTYDSIDSAKKKQGKFVHIMAKLDKSQPIEYDPVKNPNYLTFSVVDSLGGKTRIVYRNSKPQDLERSESIVMKGRMQADHFECSDILLKCPSKYKNKEQLQKNFNQSTADTY